MGSVVSSMLASAAFKAFMQILVLFAVSWPLEKRIDIQKPLSGDSHIHSWNTPVSLGAASSILAATFRGFSFLRFWDPRPFRS